MSTSTGTKSGAAAAVAAVAAVLLVVVAVVVLFARPDDMCALPGAGAPGAPVSAGTHVTPTDPGATTLTSGFGPRWGTDHNGVDFAGPIGTPIYAFTDGTVREAGPASGFGNWIILDHQIDGKTYSTVYGHMRGDGVLVSAGQQVTAGQEIGRIGNAGESTGPHLHFEVWDGGRLPDGAGTALDPASWVDAAVAPGSAPPPAAPGADTSAAGTSGGTGGLNDKQLALAEQTVAIGEAMGIPERGIVVALATASRESTFQLYASSNVPDSLNYPHDAVGSDHLSVNQFQQQVTIWGDTATLMNPATANRLFYEHLLAVPGWESMPTAVAAQTVQGSQLPGAYAEHEPLARTLYAQFKGAGKDLSAADRAALAGARAAATVGSGAVDTECADAASNPNGPTFTPGGPFGANVIAAAMAWLGTPYAWGGGNTSGPTNGISDGGGAGDANGDTGKVGFDCSGLTLYAVFHASGGAISLPHFTGDTTNAGQLYDPRGQEIPLEQKQPGDLIYFGSGGDTHHVGIYYGVSGGTEMLLNAPQSGDVVSIMPLSGWSGEDMYVRRFG